MRAADQSTGKATGFVIRPVLGEDLARVIALEEKATGDAKSGYWHEIFRNLEADDNHGLTFLVAERGGEVVGFITGEVRAFEFGSEPCGWVFALTVDPKSRVQSIGTRLFGALCEHFKAAGVDKVRTMLARDNHLVLAFFRSLGMMAGPFIQMEKDLD